MTGIYITSHASNIFYLRFERIQEDAEAMWREMYSFTGVEPRLHYPKPDERVSS